MIEYSADYYVFQFTHPGRGATLRVIARVVVMLVSIHAPREGCDASDR